MRLTDGAEADLVIDAAGRDSTRHQAMRMVRVDGRIGLFGIEEKPGLSTYPVAEVFRRRPTIEMTWGAQFEPGLASFVTAAADVVAGTAGLSALVTHRVAVSDIDRAFRLAADYRSGAVKVAVTFWPPTSRG
jgi:alcohol dehydrogenase